MIKPSDVRIAFLIKALIGLLFLAKISFGSILPLPHSFSFLIFQQGMHPAINVLLSFLLGMPLFLLWMKVRERHHLSGFYKLFVFLLMMTLTVQTMLQIHFVNSDESILMQFAALACSLFMVVIYGLVIPGLWSAEQFLRYVQRWSGALVVLSLVMWPLAGGAFFKGGRFIGVFKHIPYMVTCATVAFVFSLGLLTLSKDLKERTWAILVLITSFLAIILTGTRSSAAALLVALLLTVVLHKSRSNQSRIFKTAMVACFITFSLFFGTDTIELAQGLATGKTSLGDRQAQDGVASRWEEVERGGQIFQEEPWLGHGLVSKFSSGSEVDVSNYNAMKDPHNIFISAGVIGGWPMLILAAIALIFMTIGAFKALRSDNISKRQLGIYLAAHIPILVIYHVHLSLGGLADRMYWLVFGFLAASINFVPRNQPKQRP